MTDVEERLRRALRIIADDLTVPDDVEPVQDQLTARPLAQPTVEPNGRQHRWRFAAGAAATVAGVAVLATLLSWRGSPARADITATVHRHHR